MQKLQPPSLTPQPALHPLIAGWKHFYHRLLGYSYELSLTELIASGALWLPRRLLGLVCKTLRKVIGLCGDPLVKVRTPYGLTNMPLSHELPGYYFRFPLYDSVINRLGQYIRVQHHRLMCIDVGGNIGDSALCACLHKGDKYLLIEPTPVYRTCATANLQGSPADVEIVDCLVGAVHGEQKIAAMAGRGTARFTHSDNAGLEKVTTIDTLVSTRSHLTPNFIKIDTDGHDLACLQGARQTIKSFTPFVMFEADSFGNPEYSRNLLDCLQAFSECGYEHMLVYSNVGHLVWAGSIAEVASVAKLLFYQLTSGAIYYDILVVPRNESFIDQEFSFFANSAQHKANSQAARLCINFMTTPDRSVR